MRRFKIRRKSFVDRETGLVWKKHTRSNKTWDEAKSLENDKWRLPTIQDLATLVDYTQCEPAVSPEIRKYVNSSFYWSSITHATYPSKAWGISFYEGQSGYASKRYSYYVRLVRRL